MTKKTPKLLNAHKYNRKNIVIALCIVAAILVTGAFAYLSSSKQYINAFSVGDVKARILEPHWNKTDTNNNDVPDAAENIVPTQILPKDPQIENTGDNDAFIYIMLTVPKADGIYIFDSVKGKAPVSDYPLFTMQTVRGETVTDLIAYDASGKPYSTNSDWDMIDYKVEDNEAYDYYLFAYNKILPSDNDPDTPDIHENITPTLFDTITFANIVENEVWDNAKEDVILNVDIDAYAIQSNFGDGVTQQTSAAAWELYVKQNGWRWPQNLVVPHYTLISYNEAIVNSISYTNETDTIVLPNAISTSFNNCEFVGWVAENDVRYQPGTEIQISDLFIKDTSGKTINPFPKLREIVSTTKVNSQLEAEKELPVKLIPVNESSTAMIERTDSNGTVVESYNDGYFVITESYGYQTPSSYNEWYVYGLAEGITVDKLFKSYVRVQGDGYAKVTSSCGNLAGTGTLVEVYDRHGTDVTTDDTLVEKFYVVIYGDINGNSFIDNIDVVMAANESTRVTGWSMKGNSSYTPYRVKAADVNTNHDKRVNATDTTIIDNCASGTTKMDQIVGTAVAIIQDTP